MTRARGRHSFPNHVQLTDFVASRLPIHAADVPFTYHSPRGRFYDPAKATVEHIVLSITPTPGFYTRLDELALKSRHQPLCFLHRPFGLDRRAIPRGTIILASHKRFDEMLTVGHNVPLAARLHLNLDKHAVLQGYKTDPERLMGIAAPLIAQCSLTSVRDTIQREFGTCEIFHGTQDPPPELTAVAIVNAFNPEMINRVTNLAMHEGWIIDASNLSSVLYLTGQARDTGLEAAKSCSLSVACVGHRAAEEWGIRFLAMQLRDAFPDGQVIEIFEDEELSAERREIRATPR